MCEGLYAPTFNSASPLAFTGRPIGFAPAPVAEWGSVMRYRSATVAGFLALGVGLLVTIPVTFVMMARVYELLRLRADEQASLPK